MSDGTDFTINLPGGATYTFAVGDFGFVDAGTATLTEVLISGEHVLLDGVPIGETVVTRQQIEEGRLKLVAPAEFGVVQVAFSVGNSNGFFDPVANIAAFQINGLNTAPDVSGGDGIARAAISVADAASLESSGRRILRQPDGKVLVLSSGTFFDTGSNAFALTRFNADGTVDTSFGSGGRVGYVVGTDGDTVRGLALMPDGRIVVAGWQYVSNGSGSVLTTRLWRFNADGAPDTSYGSGGVAAIDVPGGNDRGRAVLVNPDGSALVAVQMSGAMRLIRVSAAGALDTAFAAGAGVGIGAAATPFAMVRQSDGKILVGGTTDTG